LRHLAGHSLPPGASSQPRNLVHRYVSPGGWVYAAKRFLLQEPRIAESGMSRLAALKACQAVCGKFS